MTTSTVDPGTLSILTGYARGKAIAAIVQDTGIDQDTVAAVIAQTAHHNRNFARELVLRHRTQHPQRADAQLSTARVASAAPATGTGGRSSTVPAAKAQVARSRFADTGHRRRGPLAMPRTGHDDASTGRRNIPAAPAPAIATSGAGAAVATTARLAEDRTPTSSPEPDLPNSTTVDPVDLADTRPTVPAALLIGGSHLCRGCGTTTTVAGVCCQAPTTPVRVEVHRAETAGQAGGAALQVWNSQFCERCSTAAPAASTCCQATTTPVRVELHLKTS